MGQAVGLGVPPEHRGWGTGALRVAASLTWTRVIGAPYAVVTVFVANPSAVQLDPRSGFGDHLVTLRTPASERSA